MATFDIATKVIPDDHQIWALHAGRRKRQFNVFAENSVVFLEIPGFSAAQRTFADVELVRQHLRMADAVVRYSTGADQNPPSRNPNSYSSAVDPKDKGFNASVGNARSLYHLAKPGDLVIVPGYGQYKNVLIGEIADEFSPANTIQTATFPGEEIPFRKVRWIRTDIEKRTFSQATSRRLENRHAIINIRDERGGVALGISMEIYKATYDNFIFGEISKTTLVGAAYTSGMNY